MLCTDRVISEGLKMGFSYSPTQVRIQSRITLLLNTLSVFLNLEQFPYWVVFNGSGIFFKDQASCSQSASHF